MKTVCSAAAENWSFEDCVRVGEAVNAQTVSIGSALDHCHVPGRQQQSVADNICVIGAGIHNEPGQRMVSPFPSVGDVVKQCLGLLCDMDDPERAFVKFDHEDEVALLINNYGGLSSLELGALTDEVQSQLAELYDLRPCRTLVGAFETSLNAPGFSISLINLSVAARECDVTASKLLEFLDRPTTAVSWPNTTRSVISTAKPNGRVNVNGGNKSCSQNGQGPEMKFTLDRPRPTRDIVVDASLLDAAVRSACKAAITAEPYLTKWDMVMGDGDCGEAVKDLCEAVLRMLDSGAASGGSLLNFLRTLMETVDEMGGTLGAIFGIFLSAFYSALAKHADQPQTSGKSSGMPPIFASSVASAVESLQKHTPAREGDRTVMDVLIPFAKTCAQSNDFVAGVQTAGTKALATRHIKPRLGRATYVGDAAAKEVPDPGAWALYEILWGIAEGLGMSVTKVTYDDS